MAGEKVIAVDLVIDSGQSISELQLVEDKLKLIEESIKEVNSSDDKGLENQLKALNQTVEENNLSWSELGKTIEQYQNIALASGKNSPIGQEAIKRAGALKSEMDNLTRSVDSLATNGSNLNTALQVSQGVVAGYTAVQSITALIGEENEDLMKVMVKLQAAQGVLASIEQVRFALEKDSLVVLKAKNIWTKAQAVATNLLAGATRKEAIATATATTATKGFASALVATGIGAIVVALGLLIANFEKVKNVVIKVNDFIMSIGDSFETMSGWVKGLTVAFYPFIVAWQGVTEALEYFGVVETKAQREIRENNEKIIADLQERGKEIDELIVKHQQLTDNIINDLDREIALRKAHGEDVKELEREKLDLLKKSALEEFNLSKLRFKLFAQEFVMQLRNNELTREQIEARQEEFNELAKNLNDTKEAYLDASNNIQVYEANITTTLRNESRKRQEIRKQERDKELADRQAQLEEDKEWIMRYNEETQAVKDEFEATQRAKELEQQMADSEASAQRSLQEWEQFKAEQDRKAEYKKQNNTVTLDDATRVGELLLDINSAFLEADLKKAGNNEAKKEQIRKASFERTKKISLALAVIDGAKAITSILAQYPKFDGGIAMVGALASAVTTTAIQIAKIKSTSYQSSGSVGSVTSSISSGFTNSSSSDTQDATSQGLTQTDVTQLIQQNNTTQQVLVVDDFNKVNQNQIFIENNSTI